MYYIMGQFRFVYYNQIYYIEFFSKFVLPDSFRIDLEVDKPDDQLEVIGFETPKNQIVVVLLNRSPDRTFNLSISIENQHNKQLEIELESKSIKTVIWII
jgi:O-glycosyl hydrolase